MIICEEFYYISSSLLAPDTKAGLKLGENFIGGFLRPVYPIKPGGFLGYAPGSLNLGFCHYT